MPHLSDHCHLSFAIKPTLLTEIFLKHQPNSSWPNIIGFSGISSLRTDLRMVSNHKLFNPGMEAAVKHDSIDTASELISETWVEECKEAGLKARGSKIKKSQNKWFDLECEEEKLQSLG